MNYIEKIHVIQKSSGKTQTELAQVLGVSFKTFNSWINGKSTPRKRALENIDALYFEYVGSINIDESILIEKKEKIEKFQKQYKNPFGQIMNRKDLYNVFLLEMTYHTNSIEGSTFNEPEVRAVLFDDVTIPNRTVLEHQEVKNHQGALAFVMRWIRDENGNITESLIKRIHEILMNSILHNAGQYRTHNVRIAGANVATSNPFKIDEHMKEFVREFNKPTKDIITHIAQTHARFEKIHPFSNGNGRVGRLLMLILAFRNDLAPVLVKKEKKIAYYNYLQEAQNQKNYIPLISFTYDGILSGYKLLEEE
ncbi:MAG: Fic family protein [Candidatus Colwellbacteria bacterium]|nr:Fic family protein [Candidatus Colwellbacteria bacterium]